jgi:hypothetical protein
LEKAGATWHVVDGQLEIIKNDTTNSDDAIVLSAATGLIGTPAFEIDEGRKLRTAALYKKKLEIKSLLIPKLNPGRQVNLESKLFTGAYKIESVIHAGDTHGQEWASTTKVTAL